MNFVIVGAGGQGLVVAEIIAASKASGWHQSAVAFVDDDADLHGRSKYGVPVIGPIDALGGIPHDGVVVAIGDNETRRRITLRLEDAGEPILTVRHPFSSIASDVPIGPGSMISAGVVVVPAATIGRGVLLNTKASVDHEAAVGDFAHLGPGATVGANVFLGEETFIGLGASVLSGIRIGARTIVGAGAAVVKDLPEDVVAAGVPARIIRRR